MLAIEISSFGGPDVLKPAERPQPHAGAGEIVIRMEAAGVARADSLQRQGKYPPPPGASDILGLDVAGVIAETGAGVDSLKTGDRVCAILAGGGYAEFCSVPAVQALPIPEGWSFVEASTLPENLFTVFDNLITRAELKAGETVLIHGGSSGIGTTAIMLSRAVGAIPIVTAGSDDKCQACLEIGADRAINYREADFVADVLKATEGRGADVILDMVGGPYLERNLKALAIEGRIAIIATQGGTRADLDIRSLMHKRARIMGSTMRARTAQQKGLVAERLRHQIWPLLPSKDPIRPIIDCVFPLTQARLAHRRMESGEHIGKIVLKRDSS